MFSFLSKLINGGVQVPRVSTQELEKILKDKDTILIDVRTSAEFAQGHISGAKSINVMDTKFSERIAKLDKSKNYYVNCRSGARSMMACKKMKKMGFENVWNVSGGILQWSGKIKK